MARRARLACGIFFALLLLALAVDIEARKTSGGRRGGSSSSWGWGSKSRTTPKSKPQHESHGGSNPGTIGWNVPSSHSKPASGAGTVPKPSAPSSEHASKATATNVHSSYPYGNTAHQGNPPPYSASGTGGYNPSPGGAYHGQSYNPSGYHGQSYNPSGNSHGQSYNPSGNYHGQSYNHPSGNYHAQPYNPASYNPYGNMGHSYSNTPGQGYNPSYGHSSFGGSSGYASPQPQTVILQSSRPGIGQLAKEAFVYAGVNAGVNAAVSRILPGGIFGHSHGSSSSSNNGVVPPVTHTEITYNNYYNNGTGPAAAPAAAPVPSTPVAAAPAAAAPAAPAATSTNAQPSQAAPSQPQQPPPSNPSQPQFLVSDADLQKLTEELYTKDTNNAFKHITIKLQGQKTDDSTTDDAPENLLEVKPEAYEIPTVKAVLAMHDNYELDVKTKETVTSEERREESDLLDAFIDTDVMKTTMKFLSEKGYVPNDEYEFKDALKRIWFSQFKRMEGDPSSSGFEVIFLAEKFDNEIIGLHDWIYFAKQEEAKKLNYLGYIKKLDLGSNGAIIKARSKLNDIVQPITTILVGTSPELEMALYTLCFYTRPNSACPLKMGGANFIIVANQVNYFGKDIIISAYPDI